jgi:hypothetical protein
LASHWLKRLHSSASFSHSFSKTYSISLIET